MGALGQAGTIGLRSSLVGKLPPAWGGEISRKRCALLPGDDPGIPARRWWPNILAGNALALAAIGICLAAFAAPSKIASSNKVKIWCTVV